MTSWLLVAVSHEHFKFRVLLAISSPAHIIHFTQQQQVRRYRITQIKEEKGKSGNMLILKGKIISWCFCFGSGFPGGSVVKNPPTNAGDVGSIPGSGRSPEDANGNLLPYSCLEIPGQRNLVGYIIHGVTKSRT